jgi:glycosyltransferase involved in cell wall biosynthesis
MALADIARTRRYEAAYLERFAQVLVTSPEDRWALKSLAVLAGQPTGAISVIPNGVDLDYFAPYEGRREAATIVLSGKMSYHANHSAAIFLLRQIMPLVWRERRDVRVMVVGASPAPAIHRFAADDRVSVTGYVPDLRPYLSLATLAVCSIPYGVGIQNKTLEAMALGTPVITSRQTTAALAALPGRDLLVADGPADFAAQILNLLVNPARQRALALAGRAYVEQHHAWHASLDRLEQVYALATDPPVLQAAMAQERAAS